MFPVPWNNIFRVSSAGETPDRGLRRGRGYLPGGSAARIDTQILGGAAEIEFSDGEEPTVPVINMGVSGEDTNAILGRNGAVPYVIDEKFMMPGDSVPVDIIIKSASGNPAFPKNDERAGMETVNIGGVEGTLNLSWETGSSKIPSYSFTRAEEGQEKLIPAGTRVITSGSEKYRNYLPVIFMGINGDYDSPRDLIDQHNAIIRHQIGNPRDGTHVRFIVVGTHVFKDLEEARRMEDYMQEAYGEQYINLRKCMSEQAMTDVGLTPTEEDLARMEAGKAPASLMADKIHLNAKCYELLGNLVFDRMDNLHYFDEVNQAIDRELAPEETTEN